MCGLFGMAGPGIVSLDLEFMRELAYVSGLRGLDGTGFVQGQVSHRRTSWMVEKSSFAVYDFLSMLNDKNGNKFLLNSLQDNFVLGHVRAATRGGISKSNSHPFEFENLIGMHNGTLKDTTYISKDKTDSELMFQAMDSQGIVPVLASLHKESAWAVAIFDIKNDKVVLGTNGQRPLCFAAHKHRNVVYWASEAGMLAMCAARNNISIDKVYSATPDHIYSFCPRTDVKQGKLPNWKKIKVEVPAPINKLREEINKHWPVVSAAGKPDPALTLNNKDKLNFVKNPTKNSKGRQFDCFCVSCGIEMTTFDQYQGQEVAPHLYNCKSCATDAKVALETKNIQHLLH